MTSIDVILSPPEIDLLPRRDLSAATAVVFDILRATSTFITALAHGAASVWPVASIDDALALKKNLPHALLGGERHGDIIPGFDLGNSPLEYRDSVRGRDIISTTTNGTVALRAVSKAASILPAALLNLQAVASHIIATPPPQLILVCAGTFRDAALEDILAAGLLISLLHSLPASLTDSALTALALTRQHTADLPATLRLGANGRALLAKNRGPEIDWCASLSRFPLLALMHPHGSITSTSTPQP